MAKRLLIFVCVFFFNSIGQSQTTQDTINNPYWIDMMFDHSNNFYNVKRAYELYYSNKPLDKSYKKYHRWAYYWKQFINGDGTFPAPDKVLNEYKKFKSKNLQTRSSSGSWKTFGPKVNPTESSNRSGIGRINAVGFHPTDPNTIYAGAPQGGFWKSTNKGGSWSSSTDDMPTLGVSAIATFTVAGPNPKILIGTGDRDAKDAAGLGVYVSTDGGTTFTASNSGMGNVTVGMFAVNNINKNTIFAATSGGIYASYDQGNNWVKKSTNSFNYKDIKYNPVDTNVIYATANGDFYRSTNAGTTWTMINTGLNTTATRNRLAIGVCPNNGEIVYLLASKSTSNTLEAFYKSSNRGLSFTPKITNTPNILGGRVSGNDTRGQGWYDIAIIVSPTDSNKILVGGINTFKSLDGGDNWTCSSSWYGELGYPYVHADIHSFSINPLNSELYIGSDGGVDRTINFGNSFKNLNDSLVITQFYNLAVSQLDNNRVLGGAQDNGSSIGFSPTNWDNLTGGDGIFCDISNTNLNNLVTTYQRGEINYSTNNGVSFTNKVIDTSIWTTPLQLHPKFDNILVAVFKNVWYSKDFFNTTTFTKLTTGDTVEGSAIRFSNKNDNLVFMGWENGKVKYIDNILSATPTLSNAAVPPGGGSGTSEIKDIETSFVDDNVIYVCQGNKVYKSSNRGSTYNDITLNLPNISKNCIVLDKNSKEGLYVGTTAGVYYKNSDMPQWVLFNTGLPTNSSITDLEIVYDTTCSSKSVIFASTYGRGMWRGDLFSDNNNPVASFNIPSSACITLPVNFVNTSSNTVSTSVYKWTITPKTGVVYLNGTDSSSINPTVQFNTAGNYDITLKVSNPNGTFCTEKSAISIGNSGTITILSGPSTPICLGDTVIVKLTGMDTFYWPASIPSVDILNDSTAIIYPTSTTTYKVYGTINGICKDTVDIIATVNPVFTYSITGKNKFCQGDSTNLAISGADSVIWNPIPFSISNKGTSAKLKPTTTTTYNLTMSKAGWCTIRTNYKVNISVPPLYSFNVPKTNTLCIGDSILIRETNVPNDVWEENNAFIASSNQIKVSPSVTTTYYVHTIDTNYCLKYDTVNVNVIPKPSVSIIGKKELCFNDSILLIAYGANSFVWSPMTDLTILSDDSVICTANTTTTYTVTGTSASCDSKKSITISVGQSMPAMNIKGDSIMCKNSFTDLTVSGANQYSWTPDSIVSNPFGTKVRVRPSNSTTIKVFGNNSGCRDSISYPITVRPTPNTKIANLSKSSICEGESISFQGTGASFYMVNPPYNISKVSNESFVAVPRQSVTYYLVGFDSKGCSSLDSTVITVNPKPTITISPDVSTIYQRDSLILTAQGASSYVWKPDSVISGSKTSSSILVKPMSYVLMKVIGTTAQQCSDSAFAQVYVLYKAPVTPPTTGIDLIQDRVLLIYPIPANNELIIDGKEKMSYILYDMTGREVLQSNKFEYKHKLPVEHLSNGNYMLQVETVDQIKNSIKVEIKH